MVVDPVHHLEIGGLVARGLGYGEASSIVLAYHLSVPLVMDDKRAIKIAQKMQIPVLTTTNVVGENIRQSVLTVAQADRLIVDWEAVKDFPITVRSFRELFPDM